jgi:hypothetical protein
MPPQQGIGSDDRSDLTERLSSQTIGPRGKSPPVVIGEAQAPATQLPPQLQQSSETEPQDLA